MKNALKLIGAALGLVLALAVPPAVAQQGVTYGKVEQPWVKQGKISGGISVTGSSAATVLPTTGFMAWICNTGANDAYLEFGADNTVTAASTRSTWLKASTCSTYDIYPFFVAAPYKYVAAITASSTTTLTVETGIGSGPTQTVSAGGGTVTLGPGSAIVGKFAIDQTTPGTTNAVQQVPSTPGTVSGSVTNPTSTLTMTSATTAYTSGQLIATSATAGSVVNPSFAIANAAGGAAISRLRLSTNDTTSTAWAGVTVQVDLWTATPTWTSGDRATWLPGTGAGSHLGSYTCVFTTPVWGDGLGTECAPSVGNFAGVKLASGTSIYWSLKAVTASGVTGASKVFTLIAELLN